MSETNNTNNSDEKAEKQPHLSAKEEVSEFAKTALIAIILAVLIRTFLYEPFNIPSGSMKPTLEIGDYLFVHKPSYGYSRYSFPFGFAPIKGRVWADAPERGDIIVFKLPSDPSIDYIKRVIGMPGDTVQVRNGRLYINGELVERRLTSTKRVSDPYRGSVVMKEYLEILPGGARHAIYEEDDNQPLDDTPLYTVPDGHYFMMGDNRDNSQDSRVTSLVGPVPYENLVGKADFIFFSTDGSASIFEFWKWPSAIRYERFFKDLNPERS